MWFQDPVTGYWWNSSKIVYFFTSGSGTAWYIKFLSTEAGTQTYSGPYLSELLTKTALAALVATFTI